MVEMIYKKAFYLLLLVYFLLSVFFFSDAEYSLNQLHVLKLSSASVNY